MYNKITNAKHVSANADATAAIDHRNLKTRATAALVAGCLALTMVPGVALAAQPGQSDQQGDMPAMQQDAGRDYQANGFDRGGQPSGDFGSFDQDASQNQQGNMNGAPQGEAPDFSSDMGGEAPSGEMPSGNFGFDGSQPGGETPSDGAQPSGDMQFDGSQPGGEMPSGDNAQPGQDFGGPRGNETDDQIRQLLADDYNVESPTMGERPNLDGNEAGQPGEAGEAPDQNGENGMAAPGMPGGFGGQGMPGMPGEAPELPEGAVNVQKVIDSTHDVLRNFGASLLATADFSDESFVSELTTYVNDSTEQREAMFASGETPGGAPQGDMAEGAGAPQAPEGSEAGAPDSNTAPTNAPEDQNVDSSLLKQIVDFLMGLFS